MTSDPESPPRESESPWILHPAEVAVLDRNAEALGCSVRELMGAAGSALATCAAHMAVPHAETGADSAHSICILCGPGNNGGDGYSAALQLERQGFLVRLLASSARQHGSEAQYFREQCQERGIPIHLAISDNELLQQSLESLLRPAALLVDCLLGAGFTGTAPRGAVAQILKLCSHMQREGALAPVLACDIPSGLGAHTDSPTPQPSSRLCAVRTLSFHAPKLSMYEIQGGPQPALRPEVGELQIAPLPWPLETGDCGPGELLRLPPLCTEARKGQRGRLLVVGGGPYHGAPLLAALAAGRSGCDLVHLAMPGKAAGRSPWPLFVIPENLPDKASPDVFDTSGCDYLLQRCEQMNFDAVLLGPGLGRESQTMEAIWQLILGLIQLDVPLVLDADALYLLSLKSPGRWPASENSKLPEAVPMRGIVTPHRGELQRWLGKECSPAQVLAEVLPGSLASAKRAGEAGAEEQLILCSGSTDVLMGQGGRRAHCSGGAARLACAGTGDLLAGLCVSLLAQGMSPWAAGRLACYLLRRAGDLAAGDLGLGLVADDLPLYIAKYLGQVFGPNT